MVVILRTMTALSAFAAIFAATGGGPGSATEILNLYAYRTSFTELNLGYGASLAMVLLAITLAVSWLHVPAAEGATMNARRRMPRRVALCAVRRPAAVGLGVPGAVGAAHLVQDRARRARLSAGVSSSTPTLANYREVLFGASSILPNLWSSMVVATLGHAAHDAVRGARRLRAGAAALSRPSAPAASTCWPRRCCRRWA